MTPAHLAVEHEDLPKLRELLDAGADIENPDEQGFTLLLHAIDIERDGANQTGEPLHVSMTAFLLARGADPLRRDGSGATPLDFAETTGHWLAAELIRAWIRRRS
ncbi:ankyrin repeat domain-containing protein [Micromonospora coerulea]|uniref:ankyrin repeat domain-containing protein n=1 Tax=Micromonospora coerulea TaxID=47856 RepID=UPI001908514D|nr:ankyrin repeat domain-containing protein [Micromonospora veneta]